MIATCSAADRERVQAAGADHVFDYADPDLAARIMDGCRERGHRPRGRGGIRRNAAMLAEVMAENGHHRRLWVGPDMTPALPFGAYLFKALKIDITARLPPARAARSAAITRLHAALRGGALVPAILHGSRSTTARRRMPRC